MKDNEKLTGNGDFLSDIPTRSRPRTWSSSRRFEKLSLLLVLVTGFVLVNDVAAGPPNVVVILADDQGWGDLSLSGNPNLETPNIDSIARDGAKLDHFYVCAVCSPTRAEFLTGRYHNRMGVYSTSAGGERFNTDEVTIAEVFRQAGYTTAAYGKWHNGMQAPYHPNTRGFDDYYGFCSGHWGNYFSPMLEHNGDLVNGNGFLVDDFTDHAIEFIRDRGDHPFFVYLPYNTPHSPMQAPQDDWARFKDKPIQSDPAGGNKKQENLDFTRAALAMVSNIDRNVGRLLATLTDEGVAEDTIVIYFSDNGPNSYRFNGGMRGRKGSTFEGGLRSPCVVRYPAKIRPGTVVDQPVAAIDLLPTLMGYAGLDTTTRDQAFRQRRREVLGKRDGTADAKPLDGKSLVDLLSGESEDSLSERLLFSQWKTKSTVRSSKYRFHHTGELYDIESDPGEQADVSQQHPQVTERMSAALERWQRGTEQSNHVDPESRPFPLGHPAMRQTQLPARDAHFLGTIQRSNRWPNCSYLRHWTEPTDTIVWDVDVVEGGDFEVLMKYACLESSVGTRLELAGKNSSVSARVLTANPVGETGADDDLVPRMEGYVKDWATMSLGTIRLDAGAQQIRMSAPEIEGSEAVELRLLMFVRR